MLLNVVEFCNDKSLKSLLSITKRILLLLQIIVPVLLIVMATIDLIKLINNPDDKKGIKKVFNKFMAALVFFMIPVMINGVMGIVGESTTFSSCWNQASKQLDLSQDYVPIKEDDTKTIFTDPSVYEKGIAKGATVKMNYNSAVDLGSAALRNASHSDPSVVVVSDNGVVLAQRKPKVLREGASTTKVFTGLSAIRLLDVDNDKVVGTNYATSIAGQWNNNTIAPGQQVSVLEAATRAFPDSSNAGAESIAIAIGYKKHNCSSDEEAHQKGMEEINKLVKMMGCEQANFGNASGLEGVPKGKMIFASNGYPKAGHNEGHSASDLALITIEAMKDENFLKSYTLNTSKSNSSLANNINNDGLFFIKSGTGYLCHGVWGFNYQGKRYYIALLGVNCKSGDDKYQIVRDIKEWTIINLL